MTLVVDASAIAELLLGTRPGKAVLQAIGGHDLIAPSHFSAEVFSVVRGLELGGRIDELTAHRALGELQELAVMTLPVEALLSEAWRVRHNFSAYDALYVALARGTGNQLITLDRRLAAAAPDVALLPQAN